MTSPVDFSSTAAVMYYSSYFHKNIFLYSGIPLALLFIPDPLLIPFCLTIERRRWKFLLFLAMHLHVFLRPPGTVPLTLPVINKAVTLIHFDPLRCPIF